MFPQKFLLVVMEPSTPDILEEERIKVPEAENYFLSLPYIIFKQLVTMTVRKGVEIIVVPTDCLDSGNIFSNLIF